MTLSVERVTQVDEALKALWREQYKSAQTIVDPFWDLSDDSDAQWERISRESADEMIAQLQPELDSGTLTLLVAKDDESGKALASVMLVQKESSFATDLGSALAARSLSDADQAVVNRARTLQIENFITSTTALRPAQITVLMQKLGRAIYEVVQQQQPDILFSSVVNPDLPPIIERLFARRGQQLQPAAIYQLPADHTTNASSTIAAFRPEYRLDSLGDCEQKTAPRTRS